MNVPTANIAADAPVLLREREKDIAILVLNRPDVRNSLSEAMLIALSSALGRAAFGDKTRAHPCCNCCSYCNWWNYSLKTKAYLFFDYKIWLLQVCCSCCSWEMVGIFSPQKY